MLIGTLEQPKRIISPELRVFGALAGSVWHWIDEMKLSQKFQEMVQDYYIEARRLISYFESQINGRDFSRVSTNRLLGYSVLVDNLRDQVNQEYEIIMGASK